MKVAIIRPDAHLEDPRLQTDFHLVLAQQVLASKDYLAYYQQAIARGNFVILDNDAAELGQATSDDLLLEAAELLRPHVVVAPDVLFDTEQTLARTNSFLKQAKSLTVMAVPQGKTAKSYLECFEAFNKDSRVQWLGITKYCVPAFPCRLDVLSRISSLKPCHLLGMPQVPWDLAKEKRCKFAVSNDSSVPIRMALQDLPLDYYSMRKHYDSFFDQVLTEDQLSLAINNVRKYINLARS